MSKSFQGSRRAHAPGLARLIAGSRLRTWARTLLCTLVVGCAGSGGEAGSEAGPSEPDGLVFPATFQVQCQSEVCIPGRWLACDSVPVVEAPLRADRVVGWLTGGDWFEVPGANIVVREPGIVRVVRGFEQGDRLAQTVYRPGDTVYILGYRGEGHFTVWYRGGLTTADVFWPWSRGTVEDPTGDLLREAVTEFWIRAEMEDGTLGWVLKEPGKILDPLAAWSREGCGEG